MKYKSYIFDLDGTLLNTIEDLTNSCNYALQCYGLPVYSVKDIQNFVGNGIMKLMEKCIPQGIENPLFKNIYECFRAHYLSHNNIHTMPYNGIMELLQKLNDHGKHVAVVSNKFDMATKNLVKQYFGDYISVSVGESQNMSKKPAPDMVYAAMRQLKCNIDETVYIGDSDVDIETAKNCGLPCLSVLWGFRNHRFLINHGATTLVSHPIDILSI